MNKLKKFIYSKYSKYIISIILGLGLATIFNTTCDSLSCMKLKAPHTNRIEKHTWLHNNNCYRFKTKTTSCNKNKKKIMR